MNIWKLILCQINDDSEFCLNQTLLGLVLDETD